MVCEVAATFQGILPVDMGDPRYASLNQEQTNNILDLVAGENEITDMFIENSSAKSSSAPLKSRSV